MTTAYTDDLRSGMRDRKRGRPSLQPARFEAKGQQQLRELARRQDRVVRRLAALQREMLDAGRGTL
jgi:hypothetical protein